MLLFCITNGVTHTKPAAMMPSNNLQWQRNITIKNYTNYLLRVDKFKTWQCINPIQGFSDRTFAMEVHWRQKWKF